MRCPPPPGSSAHALASPFGEMSDRPFIITCRLLVSGIFLVIFARQWCGQRRRATGCSPRGVSAAVVGAAGAGHPALVPHWRWSSGAALPWPRRSLAWVAGPDPRGWWCAPSTWRGRLTSRCWPCSSPWWQRSLLAGSPGTPRPARPAQAHTPPPPSGRSRSQQCHDLVANSMQRAPPRRLRAWYSDAGT